jgi:hypothetical protein
MSAVRPEVFGADLQQLRRRWSQHVRHVVHLLDRNP